MAKSKERLQARGFRRDGMSIIEIAKKTRVSKSTVSRWCQDIELTPIQIDRLLKSRENGMKLGQLIGARMQKQKRMEKVDKGIREGASRFRSLGQNEFFTAGLALYLAEGAKTKRQVFFVNSDPRVIAFMMNWFQEMFRIPKDDITFSVMINEIHRPREKKIIDFWTSYLRVSPSQFRATVFVKTQQKKTYENHDIYYGTLRFRLLKSTDLYYKIAGLIEGLLLAKTTPA